MIDLLKTEKSLFLNTLDEIVQQYNRENNSSCNAVWFNGWAYHARNRKGKETKLIQHLNPDSLSKLDKAIKQLNKAKLDATICNQSLAFIKLLIDGEPEKVAFFFGSCIPKLLHESIYMEYLSKDMLSSKDYLEGCAKYPHPDHLYHISKLEKVVPLFQKFIIQDLLIL